MLGSPALASATTQTTTSNVATASPARPSRLRGLSYLRSYTREHLHSSSTTFTPFQVESPPLHRSTSSPSHGPRANRSRANSDIPVASPVENSEGSSRIRGQAFNVAIRTTEPHTSTPTESTDPGSPAQGSKMTRNRTVVTPVTTAAAVVTIPSDETPNQAASTISDGPDTTVAISSEAGAAQSATSAKDTLPTIRFIPHIETRSSRPSLQFTTISRTLKNPNNIVRVGRYNERDVTSYDENVILVGFKSKVVSRRHCEFWCTNGQWFVKDVKSSSGTFLNHVRLSSPGTESRPFPVNDGDVIQLGIDFKGGEEIIFRCVKIRIECNRDWQKSLNSFNTSAHKRILRNAVQNKVRDSDAGSVNNSECSICLNPVSPCQALFVAPCGHLWHYKCIRNLIHSPSYPNFLCPNCRLVADLDADVEPPESDIIDEEDMVDADEIPATTHLSGPENLQNNTFETNTDDQEQRDLPQTNGTLSNEELVHHMDETSIDITNNPKDSLVQAQPNENGEEGSQGTKPIPINTSSNSQRDDQEVLTTKLATPTAHADFASAAGAVPAELMTPRNDAGPFVLDGNSERFSRLQLVAQRMSSDEPSSSSS